MLSHLGTWGKCIIDGLITFCCTIPCAPFLSFIFHFTGDKQSRLRDIIDFFPCYNFDWFVHTSYIFRKFS